MGKITKKTYGIYGMVEHSILIGHAGSNVRIRFSDGRITVRGIEPCTFTTDNAAVQQLIEQTDKFKNKYIRLVRKEEVVIDDEPSVDDVQSGGDEPSAGDEPSGVDEDAERNDTGTYPDVKNSQQAKKVLMEQYGVSMSELGDVDSVRAKAEEVGVLFPNWK